jgi:hypothetical protein
MDKVTETCTILSFFIIIMGLVCDLYRFQVTRNNQMEQWAVHVAKMGEEINAHKSFLEDRKGWMKLAQDSVHWWT